MKIATLSHLLAFAGMLAITEKAAAVSALGFSSSSTTLQNTGDSFALTGAFLGTSNPAYVGPVSVTGSYTESGITTAPADSYVVAEGTLGSLQFTSGPGAGTTGLANQMVTVSIDFTTLAGAFLPAGGGFAVFDLDGNSNALVGPLGSVLQGLRAYDASNTLITTPWLTNFLNFDFEPGPNPSSPGQPDPIDPADYATVGFSGGEYNFTSATTSTATPVISAALSQNVSRIEFSYFGVPTEVTNLFITDTQIVPEPSAALLLGLAGTASLRMRRRA